MGYTSVLVHFAILGYTGYLVHLSILGFVNSLVHEVRLDAALFLVHGCITGCRLQHGSLEHCGCRFLAGSHCLYG